MIDENNLGDNEFEIGSLLAGRYFIEKELGRGGQGLVMKALDSENYDNPVVIKTLLSENVSDWEKKKFEQEKEALAKLQGSNGVVNLIGKGISKNGKEFTVLEFLEGLDLSELSDELSKNLPRTANLFRQIAATIDYAHIQGVYHRDLKPQNIRVLNIGEFGELAKIIDFGIVSLEQSVLSDMALTKEIVGTPFYLSPNALNNNPALKADDIYALGMIAYEMVTGDYPISKKNISFSQIIDLQKNINSYLPSDKNPNLSKSVDTEILIALSENPEDRHKSAKEFGENLYRALLNTNNPIDGTQPIDEIPKKEKNSISWSLVTVGLLMVIILGGIIGFWGWLNWNKESEVAADFPAKINTQNSNTNKEVSQNSNRQILAENTSPRVNISNSLKNEENSNTKPKPSDLPEPTNSPASLDTLSPNIFTIGLSKRDKNQQPVSSSTSEVFKAGDGIRLNFTPDESGFLQIYMRENNGKVSKVFGGKVEAGKGLSFPSPKWFFFDDQPGTETVYFVLSKTASSNKTDVNSLESESNGRSEFSTKNGAAVKVVKLNHAK